MGRLPFHGWWLHGEIRYQVSLQKSPNSWLYYWAELYGESINTLDGNGRILFNFSCVARNSQVLWSSGMTLIFVVGAKIVWEAGVRIPTEPIRDGGWTVDLNLEPPSSERVGLLIWLDRSMPDRIFLKKFTFTTRTFTMKNVFIERNNGNFNPVADGLIPWHGWQCYVWVLCEYGKLDVAQIKHLGG